MNAASLVPTTPHGDLRFGLGRPEVLVADLRALADAIEGGRVKVSHIETDELAGTGDFPESRVTLRYFEFKASAGSDHG